MKAILIIPLIFINSNVHAITIKINKEEVSKNWYVHDIVPREIIFSYHTIEVNGKSYDSLKPGIVSSRQEGEMLEFEVDGTLLPFSPEISDRIFTLILNGWQSVIEFLPLALLTMPSHMVSFNPPCGFVCIHLMFGIGDFTITPKKIDTIKLDSRSVAETSKSLSPGQILLIKNPGNPDDNNSVMYLGKDFFLCWECQEKATLQHTEWVDNASFSPDGYHLVTASCDNTAKIRELVDGQWQEKATLQHTGWVNNASFSPDGYQLVTASRDNTAKIWKLVDGQWQEKATIQHTDCGSVMMQNFSSGILNN